MIRETKGGGYHFEFFSPANNPGYVKQYVQVMNASGAIVREHENTIGPEGVIETKGSAALSRLSHDQIEEALVAVIGGDLSKCAVIAGVPHHQLLAAARGRHLLVTRESAVAVLRALLLGVVSPSAVQCWASLVRRGYLTRLDGATLPLDIDYDVSVGDEIVEVAGRLEQIGDAVDGRSQRASFSTSCFSSARWIHRLGVMPPTSATKTPLHPRIHRGCRPRRRRIRVPHLAAQ